jgi:IS30 family transposase
MDRLGMIPNRLSIDDGPVIVDERKRTGEWEADTAIGKNHQQAIVSIVERRTGFTLIRKVERKTTHAVSQAMVGLLKPHQNKVHTLTYLGSEAPTKTPNGLIRQYFPNN